MLTTITLAMINTAQGAAIAMYQGLEVVKRELTKKGRKQEQAARMADAVRRDIERLPSS